MMFATSIHADARMILTIMPNNIPAKILLIERDIAYTNVVIPYTLYYYVLYDDHCHDAILAGSVTRKIY